MKRLSIHIFFLLILIFAVGCAVNPVSGRREFVLMSESTENALGREYHPKIIKEYGKYDDPALQAYVSQVGQTLAKFSHRPDLIYRFTVLDSTDINAFALPGGYIYITRGLLAYLNTEAELAAVLGHEIGHVTARHAVRQQTAVTATNIGMVVGQILVPELRSQAVSDVLGLLSGALLRGYGREHELESDGLGAEYLARAGYDPRAIITVLKVLKSHEEFSKEVARTEGRKIQTYHGLFATHPDNDTRLQNVVNSKRGLLTKSNRPTSNDRFLRMLSGLTFGDSASDGIRRSNKFYHKDLDFAVFFPAGWILINRPDKLLAIAPQGSATAIFTVQDINKRISPEEFLIKRFGFKKLLNGKTIKPHGLSGYTAFTNVNSSAGKRHARVSIIYYNDRAYFLIGIAKDMYRQEEVNEKMLKTAFSFHPLSNKEKILAQPLKISLIRATASTSYEKLAKESRIPGYAESQLRLLNHQYPKGEPIPGKVLKIVK